LGDQIRVTVQIHGDDGSFVKSETADRERHWKDLGQMGVLSAKLMRDLGAEAPKPQVAPPPITNNLEAYRNYSLGVERLALLEMPSGDQFLERRSGFGSGVRRCVFSPWATLTRSPGVGPHSASNITKRRFSSQAG